MKMKRYKKIQEYIRENDISQEETQKIMIERPSEIIVMHDKNNETAGSLHLCITGRTIMEKRHHI